MKFNENAELVRQLLINHPSNRDCDKKLMANVLFMQAKAKGLDPRKITMMEFLQEYVNGGTFANFETVRRARARLQELHEGLRGEKYNDRVNIANQKAKNEIKNL